MSQATYLNQILKDGFAIIQDVISDNTISEILMALEKVQLGNATKIRKGRVYAIRNLLQEVPSLKTLNQHSKFRALMEPILGQEAKVVRAIFFDKTPEANWKVTWHQDVTIAVQKSDDIEGFGPWSEKAGIMHVQAPASILENILTLRVHLDDSTVENGALAVIPGSHCWGRLNFTQIQALRDEIPAVLCQVPKGSVMIMRPLLLHASSASANPSHRRVLHFEYSASQLPGKLKWLDEK